MHTVVPGLVSVVIPAYNAARYVKEAIDSVLAQTYPSIEIVVVNDGSTDNTLDILATYGDRIQVVTQKNGGPSVARNKGIRFSRGEFIDLMDADDAWLPTKVEKQVEVLKSDPEIGMVTCSAFYVDGDGKLLSVRKAGRYATREEARQAFYVRNWIVGGPSAVMIPRTCFEEVGIFNSNIKTMEDWDMWIRVTDRFRVVSLLEPLVRYRVHEHNLHKNVETMQKGQFWFIKKYGREMGWLNRRKALSFSWQDASCEYLKAGKIGMACLSALKAIGHFPFRVYEGDDKYPLLLKTLLPRPVARVARTVRQALSPRPGKEVTWAS
ncbi:MAG: glycosyltransferase [Candidatus Omnitrophica bacterium]|nr:glycosyltransferase [Candidatus Omnitrophota bacterium]